MTYGKEEVLHRRIRGSASGNTSATAFLFPQVAL